MDEDIKQWITLNNELKIMNEKINVLRERKNNLCKKIYNYANNNRLVDNFIPLTNGKIKITTINVTQPLTFKYIEKSLGEIIKNENQIKQIVNHIKEKREIKLVPDIKYVDN
jgi:uncharacterized membrane protein YgaE (UPF0421/DUF939 family)